MPEPIAPPEAPLRIRIGPDDSVAALLVRPPDAQACYVFAHGAGAGMAHATMAAFATGLAARGVATLRFEFPFMERGSKRVDTPAVAHAAARAAVDEAARRCPGLPLFAGGKSFGGRMTSQAQALEPLANVRGLVFVGFPLHPAGKPATDRADHLASVHVPMLFLQGTRDELAETGLVTVVTASLGALATLRVFDDADHAFHVRAKSGHTDVGVREQMLADTAVWMAEHRGSKRVSAPAPAASR